MGTHLRVLNESFPMNTNMTGFRGFFHSCALDESSLSIGRVKEGFALELTHAYYAIRARKFHEVDKPNKPYLFWFNPTNAEA